MSFSSAAYLLYGAKTDPIITVSLSNGKILGGRHAVVSLQFAYVPHPQPLLKVPVCLLTLNATYLIQINQCYSCTH